MGEIINFRERRLGKFREVLDILAGEFIQVVLRAPRGEEFVVKGRNTGDRIIDKGGREYPFSEYFVEDIF